MALFWGLRPHNQAAQGKGASVSDRHSISIVAALLIKAVFLVLAIAGSATLWMAVFADMGASLLVVFNGLRLLKAGNARKHG